jgi:hypothetical protein
LLCLLASHLGLVVTHDLRMRTKIRCEAQGLRRSLRETDQGRVEAVGYRTQQANAEHRGPFLRPANADLRTKAGQELVVRQRRIT